MNTPHTTAIRRYRVIAISHDQCVNAHGVQAIEDAAGALCYWGDADAIITKLRIRLAHMEADAEQAAVVGSQQEGALVRQIVAAHAVLREVLNHLDDDADEEAPDWIHLAVRSINTVLERDKQRCSTCRWPLVADRKDGCVPGDCSYRDNK